ncbi:MAG TPA: hypothetical protein VGZ25_00005 [Gemmataceae bacterium]|jgi:hypothetical protein|nr:hypothetical protein [Gemmataceae bacterium]
MGASILALALVAWPKIADLKQNALEAGRPDALQQTLGFQKLVQSMARHDSEPNETQSESDRPLPQWGMVECRPEAGGFFPEGDAIRFRQKRSEMRVREWFDIIAALADAMS